MFKTASMLVAYASAISLSQQRDTFVGKVYPPGDVTHNLKLETKAGATRDDEYNMVLSVEEFAGQWYPLGDFTFVGANKAKISKGPGKFKELDITTRCGDRACGEEVPQTLWTEIRGAPVCFEIAGKCPEKADSGPPPSK